MRSHEIAPCKEHRQSSICLQLYTRRRDAKDTIPRPSDRVRDLSDMSDATCARLINLRQSAIDQQVEVDCRLLPEEPISTGTALEECSKFCVHWILSGV